MKKRPIIILKDLYKTYCVRGFYKMVRDMRDNVKPGFSTVMFGFIGETHNEITVIAYANKYNKGDYVKIEKVVKVGYKDKNGAIHRLLEYVFNEVE